MATHTITETATFTILACPQCGVQYGLLEAFRVEAAKDPKLGWYCTNGHSLHYPGRTKQDAENDLERMRREAQSLRAALVARDDQMAAERRSHAHTKGELTKARKKVDRAVKGVCPCCNRSFVNVQRHMENKHPDEVKQGKKVLP